MQWGITKIPHREKFWEMPPVRQSQTPSGGKFLHLFRDLNGYFLVLWENFGDFSAFILIKTGFSLI